MLNRHLEAAFALYHHRYVEAAPLYATLVWIWRHWVIYFRPDSICRAYFAGHFRDKDSQASLHICVCSESKTPSFLILDALASSRVMCNVEMSGDEYCTYLTSHEFIRLTRTPFSRPVVGAHCSVGETSHSLQPTTPSVSSWSVALEPLSTQRDAPYVPRHRFLPPLPLLRSLLPARPSALS